MNEERQPIEVRFGAMSDPLKDQLEKQGLVLPEVDKWEASADAVTLLYLNGYITKTVANRARDKIFKGIQGAVRRA